MNIGTSKIPRVIISILLLIGIADLDYGYYVFLRIVVSLGYAFIAFAAFKSERKGFGLFSIGVVILFNPIVPVYLDKDAWIAIDIALAIVTGISVFRSRAQTTGGSGNEMGLFNQAIKVPIPFQGKWSDGEYTVFLQASTLEIYDSQGTVKIYDRIINQAYQGGYSIMSKSGGRFFLTTFFAIGDRVNFHEMIFKIQGSNRPFNTEEGFLNAQELIDTQLERA